jgi:hypothetical protein
MTQKLHVGAALIDIRLIDHIILSREGHFSSTSEGLLLILARLLKGLRVCIIHMHAASFAMPGLLFSTRGKKK